MRILIDSRGFGLVVWKWLAEANIQVKQNRIWPKALIRADASGATPVPPPPGTASARRRISASYGPDVRHAADALIPMEGSDQNGFTMTRMTIRIIRTAGTSLTIRKKFRDFLLSSFAKARRHLAIAMCAPVIARTRTSFA